MGERLLIDRKGLQKALGLRGIVGRCAAGLLYRLLGLGYLNRRYPEVADLTGPEFSSAVLDLLGISYELPPGQEGLIPAEGGFLTVSNHHFGGADGLILNAVVGARRKDFKILTTFLLARIVNLQDCFIPVDNFSSGGARSLAGIRTAMQHISAGGSLGFFPAGEVATWQKKGSRTALGGKRVVEDKPWPDNIVKLIKNSGLPVVPVYFDGGNSTLFHILGRIHPMLRTIRLVREMVGKKGSTIKVRIGKPVPAEELAGMEIPEMGRYLRSRCYALEAQCVCPVKQVSGCHLAGLAEPEDPEVVRSQMERLEGKMLFQAGDYKAYLIETSDAPAVMKELYRLREETFRSVGEGTGNPLDTDSYDSYYKHLILWSESNGEIVGSYRLGYGSEIYPSRGIEGFYTASLISYGPRAASVLPTSLELGRSFVSVKYQREVLPLKLMLTGLTAAVTKDPSVTCCLGTVSISNSMPDFYKSLAVRFLENNYRMSEAELFANPTHPFKPDFLRVDPDDLLRSTGGDIDACDSLLGAVSGGESRLPCLLRKYFNCGARVSCFNVDPLFCNSLDGMILLNVRDFRAYMLRSLVRPLSKEMQDAVFRHFFGTSNPD